MSTKHKGGLGKGLDALLPSADATAEAKGETLAPVSKIVPNPRQPRENLKEENLQELAESIREHGILQPLIVTYDAHSDQYVLIAGERRLRAAILVGLSMVPVLIRQATDQERLELALIENLQRADLSPLETAEAYRQLMEDFKLTHEEIAARVGKSRTAVTNTLRLLKLPESVRTALAENAISEGHARALLALNTPQAQIAVMQTILRQNLSVRQTEDLVRRVSGEKVERPPKPSPNPELLALEERLRNHLGTKVTLRHGKKGGTLVIHYYSEEELDNLINQILKE
jgi:ParB family chromosome partitioning protein